jgi:hypothetical protein
MWCIGMLVVVIVTALPAHAFGQLSASQNEWAHGTELGLFAGAAASSTETGPIVTGTAGWDLSHWLAIEGRASWLGRGTGSEAFDADLGGLISLAGGHPVRPYFGAGFGLYRASFDGTASTMSDFYRARIPQSQVTAGTAFRFTDPLYRVTAGLSIAAHPHMTVRPEASVLFVRRDGAGETIATFGVRFGFRFEDRDVTPDR